MNWRDEVAEGLPEPRDDEPESLRRNIVDELADHLSCALVRELHFAPDEKSAIQRVLDRFGDPRKIARKLWFDSMKEKLMTQRIALATSLLGAVVSIAACAMVYFVVQQSRETTLTLVAQSQALIEQGQANDQALLARLDELAKKSGNLEFNPVKVRLVTDAPGSPPAVGCEIHLTGGGKPSADDDDFSEKGKTGSDGVFDFGLVRYGNYHLWIKAPNGEATTQSIQLPLGRAWEQTAICPAAPIEKTEVAVSVNWPEDLRKEELRTHCFLVRQPHRVGKWEWNMEYVGSKHQVVVSSDNQILNRYNWPGFEGRDASESVDADLKGKQPTVAARFPSGTYRMVQVVARRPLGKNYLEPSSGLTSLAERFSELIMDFDYLPPKQFATLMPKPPLKEEEIERRYRDRQFVQHEKLTPQPDLPPFEVKPGQKNHWEISLPAEAIEHARRGFASLRERDKRAAQKLLRAKEEEKRTGIRNQERNNP